MSGQPHPKPSWSRQSGARSGKVLTCKHCGSDFYVVPSRLRSTIKPGYCSLYCLGQQRRRSASAAWERRREFSLARKGESRCRACGESAHLHAHHAIPVSMGTKESSLDLRNLLPLCWSCHGRWHKGVPLHRGVFTRQEWAYLFKRDVDRPRYESVARQALPGGCSGCPVSEREGLLEAREARALAAFLEQIQKVLCAFPMSDKDRQNAIAGLVHRALLEHGGGYTKEAVAEREMTWEVLSDH